MAHAAPQVTTPPPKKSRKVLWIVIAVVVVVVVVIIAAVALPASASSINVTAINVTSSDDVCGLNGTILSGYTGGSLGSEQVTFTVSGGLFLSCTITSVNAVTSGFWISGAIVPLTVPAEGSAALSFTVHPPSSSFNGVLTIDIE